MQLMELSNGLILKNNQIMINPDGPLDSQGEFEEEQEGSPDTPKPVKDGQIPKKSKKISKTVREILALQQNEEENHDEDITKSLFIFAHDNKLRVMLKKLVHNSYFAGFIYHMIALNSLLLMLDAPNLTDQY
jgi:hypothetical protein